MVHLHCINNKGSLPLILVKYGRGELIAPSQSIPIMCKGMLNCISCPLNGHLLFIKYVYKCVCECF